MNSLPRILVTGAGGFIGRSLCRILVADGNRVAGTFRELPDDESRVPGVRLYRTGDLETFTDWANLLSGVDAVVHLAARVHVMGEAGSDALERYRRANVQVTETLLRASVRAGVRRFIFMSSVKAIGEGGPFAYTELAPAEPEDHYGISKLEAEGVVKDVAAETGTETVILRLPLVYGPGVRANFLRLVRFVDRGLPLPLASVRNSRSMLYIGNLVDAIRLCIEHADAAGETFMISDGQDVSSPGLIREIAAAMGKKPRLMPFPPVLLRLAGALTGKGAEVNRLLGSLSVDISKIRNKLNWAPPCKAAEGIEKTVAWYLKQASGL